MRDQGIFMMGGAELMISTLFLIAAIQYIYITYLGYNALPFIARSEILLAPLLPIFVGYVPHIPFQEPA